MANVEDAIILRDLRSSLLLETFFQCPVHSSGRRLQSGDKNTVRGRSFAQYSSNALRRFRYHSSWRFGNIHGYFKFVQSRHRPPWWKICHQLQQVGLNIIFPSEFLEFISRFN